MSENFGSSIKQIWFLISDLISNLINDKSNLSKVKVSLVQKEMSEKENILHATQLH